MTDSLIPRTVDVSVPFVLLDTSVEFVQVPRQLLLDNFLTLATLQVFTARFVGSQDANLISLLNGITEHAAQAYILRAPKLHEGFDPTDTERLR